MAITMAENPAEPHTIVNNITMTRTAKDIAGLASYTLSDSEAQTRMVRVSGTLTQNCSVVFPTQAGKDWLFDNAANGATGTYTVTVKTTGATGVTVTTGKKVLIACDGTDIVKWGTEV